MAAKALELGRPDSCLNRSQPDEPLFVLCARDVGAPGIVREWARRYRLNKGTQFGDREQAKYDEAMRLADNMEKWRHESTRARQVGL